MTNPIRIGIIGYGKMGQIRERTIHAVDGAVVTAICDPYADLSSIGHAVAFQDWRDLLKTDIDAVVISCTNDLLPEIAVAALERDLHVFCEKPPGRNVADVEAIAAASQDKGNLHLKFGFNHRYHESVEDARRFIRSGRMGDILWMRGVYGKAGGPEFDKNWRNDPVKSGGGILLDQGIHMIDLMHDFCGEFDDVKSFIGRQYWNVPVEDNAFALMRNANGQVAMLHSSATQWRHTFRLEIYLEKGLLALTGILSSTMTYGKESLVVARTQLDENGYPLPNPEETVSYYDNDRSWDKEMAEFLDAVRENKPIGIGTIDQAIAAMKAVQSIYAADSSWNPADGLKEHSA